MDAEPAKERLPRISLHPLTLEEAVRKLLTAPVEPKEPRKPGAGRKKKKEPQIKDDSKV